MTISSTSYIDRKSGNGVTTDFSTSFQFFDADELVVTLYSAAGVATLQVLSTHYSVSGGDGNEGTVSMVVPPPAGTTLVIERQTSRTQGTDYQTNDALPANAVEENLDRLVCLVQEALGKFGAVLQLPPTFADGPLSLPPPEDGKIMRWNAAEDGLENVTLADVGAAATNPWAVDLLALTDATSARTYLGLGDLAEKDTINDADWSGTVLSIANGGTGADTPAGAQAALGLGTMALQSALDVTIAGGTIAGVDLYNLVSPLPIADGGTGASSLGGLKTSLGLGDLADKDTINNSDWSGTDLSILHGGTGASDASGARSNLGLGALATKSTINNSDWTGAALAVTNGGTGATSAGGARTALGLGTMATKSTINSSDWFGADLAIIHGGTGASDASGARSNLGLGSMATQASNSVSITGGFVTATLNAGGARVTNAAGPVVGSDLATKTYVDGVTGAAFRGALVRKNAAQSVPDATGTRLTWEVAVYDTDSIFNNGNNTLVVPSGVTRVRLIGCIHFAYSAGGATRFAEIAPTGGGVYGCSRHRHPAGESEFMISTAVLTVTAGTAFEFTTYQDSGGNLNVNDTEYTWFAMEIIE